MDPRVVRGRGGGPWCGGLLSLMRLLSEAEAVGLGGEPVEAAAPILARKRLSLNPGASSDPMCTAPLRLQHAVLLVPLWAQEGVKEWATVALTSCVQCHRVLIQCVRSVLVPLWRGCLW